MEGKKTANRGAFGQDTDLAISYEGIGLRIRNLREANSYTRDAFAEKCDISSKFLYEIELGRKGFSVETLFKASKALCVSSDYLLTGNESTKIPTKLLDIIEGFTPEQMEQVQKLLKLVQELSVGRKS
ncbi:MAG: helix-turn-helix domain-containing protein [Lachnospiraceae bacterium]|nr:helix-turn-helix domain-containing protein [Lachnospiraceae bacterium]MDE7334196.1 helix-turn-helix domain-containing protein [Lachnospiraceae bacterium]